MSREIKKKKLLHVRRIIVAMFGIVLLNGCDFRMSAKDRTGQMAAEENTIEIAEPENGVLPTRTVSYQPYDLTTLGELIFHLTPDEVALRREMIGEECSMIYLNPEMTPEKAMSAESFDEPYVSATSGGSGMYFFGIPDADCYEAVISTARNQSDTELSSFHARMGAQFQVKEADSAAVETAEKETAEFLRSLGVEISYCDSYFMTLEELNLLQEKEQKEGSDLQAPGYTKDEHGVSVGKSQPWQEGQEVYYFRFQTSYQGTSIESITSGESVIQIFYSPVQKTIVLIHASIPALMDTVNETNEALISGEDAVLLANEELKKTNLSDVSITKAELVYTLPRGNYNSAEKTVLLTPGWKICYEIVAGGETIEDEIVLNAVTGEVFRNEIRY